MEQLKTIDASTPPGTRVLVVGPGGWEIYGAELVSYSPGSSRIRGADGEVHSYGSYSVHVLPEVSRG